MEARNLPYQHLSFRVPWHDTGWEGSVCADPIGNSSCLALKRIAEERKDDHELRIAGKAWEEIKPEELPPCALEGAGFMSATSRDSFKEHPYASKNSAYKKFRKTAYTLPKYSADCVPFRWMLSEEARKICQLYKLPFKRHLEEHVTSKSDWDWEGAWVKHGDNQKLLLNKFFSFIKPRHSLVFIYAKESPLLDDPRRLLIGVGRVLSVDDIKPYENKSGGFGQYIWERVITHSIRPEMKDGFLLPYHELLDVAADDLDDLIVPIPDEYRSQFSYGSEHVSHDTALEMLLTLKRSVDRFAPRVSGRWDGVKSWLNDRLAEVWQDRGPCPGLGAALTAFDIDQGVLLAHAVQSNLGRNEDPWPLVDKWFSNPASNPEASDYIDSVDSKKWNGLTEERRSLLQLLSRFDLTIDQAKWFYQPTERAKQGIHLQDTEILQNPYFLYENSRSTTSPVPASIIDRGTFPADQVREAHPLPKPSAMESNADPRRVRALVVDELENAASAGHSLRSERSVIQKIRDRPLEPPCQVSIDLMNVCREELEPVVALEKMGDQETAFQLERLNEAKQAVSREIDRRRKGKLHPIEENWGKVIDQQFEKESSFDDEDEKQARKEKAAALEVLAKSRVSVLIGAAGTGKTTLLKALSSLPEVSKGGILLLAPTGKARVQMQATVGLKAHTLAQFLIRCGRYDMKTYRYHRSSRVPSQNHRTVIVDECSMLTEEMLDALLDAIGGCERLVLAGDPRQLPPIGAGRPFVDIVEYLRDQTESIGFPRVAHCYAELTIPRRQVGEKVGKSTAERGDLLLAEWFSGDKPNPASDEVWDLLRSGKDLDTISVRQWKTHKDLHQILRKEIAKHSEFMSDSNDNIGFQESYGGEEYRGTVYFNIGSSALVEDWQILSPVRGEGHGVKELNRMLQRTYRDSTLESARHPEYERKIPKPGGPEEIVYGDKVINVRNNKREDYYSKSETSEPQEYVANGEIGVVTGPFRGKGKRKPPFHLLNIEFSTQPGIAYKYKLSELDSEYGSILELAYALTIHKAQGSEFNKTFVIIPEKCRLLSRELLYTALTRQKEHVVLLYQGDLSDLLDLSNSDRSEIAKRQTNLFLDPKPTEVNGQFLEDHLIHRTRSGLAVRSKSEVIIADLLYSKKVEFQYEQPLWGADGSFRYPDFTIDDPATGMTIYWEHLGLLHQPSYKRKWEEKLAWYRDQGVLPHDEGEGPNGTLVTSRDGENGSISSIDIEAIIDELIG